MRVLIVSPCRAGGVHYAAGTRPDLSSVDADAVVASGRGIRELVVAPAPSADPLTKELFDGHRRRVGAGRSK